MKLLSVTVEGKDLVMRWKGVGVGYYNGKLDEVAVYVYHCGDEYRCEVEGYHYRYYWTSSFDHAARVHLMGRNVAEAVRQVLE